MNNAQKKPLSRTLSAFTQAKALDEIMKRGQALPGHVIAIAGAIVTVAFDVADIRLPQAIMPLFGPEYIRYPIKVGDLGVAFPASVYMGGVSGLGGGIADTTLRGNLSTLVWFPCGNANWPTVDPLTTTLYAPHGVVLQDTPTVTASAVVGQSNVTINANTTITLAVGAHSIVINSSGVTIDGKPFLTHHHSGITIGGSNTGNVV
jgi:hypothetical protein